MDQNLLAVPHGLSQPVTSFIASIRQGIHQMPLIHLRAPPYPESKTLFLDQLLLHLLREAPLKSASFAPFAGWLLGST